ncbi:flagellar biosynthetic protein FliR [Cellulomonas denverensis]|uniref:Flagellar biosynthetic protein FliR n=1 Tax=Cellulomonas denverensis TaxID=264297 RepID=A0A7X6QZX6_9CELL|nr:flagellar biosynthetic protein FliR [Cellulomonas denverensis]NKY23546.1 flagellar biosynthetic protein FliR [Cellulomonas denverensis]GIG24087.1 flagellar biosynthetic protein FliR [Cellulomonas denverensis]
MDVTLPLATVQTAMLAGVRFAAFLVIAPPFAHRGIPGRIKAMLSVGLALAVLPRLEQHEIVSTGQFLGELVMQVVIGGALGFLVSLVFSAVQAAGGLIDLFGGFQLAQAFDPMNMTAGAQFAKLYQWTALALLFASGGYGVLIAGMARSFDALPLGASLDLAQMASAVTSGIGQMFLAALQIAGPLLAVLFLTDVGLGLLTRVSPALNAFALGFPLKILMTVTFAGFVYLAMPGVINGLATDAVDSLLGVAS